MGCLSRSSSSGRLPATFYPRPILAAHVARDTLPPSKLHSHSKLDIDTLIASCTVEEAAYQRTHLLCFKETYHMPNLGAQQVCNILDLSGLSRKQVTKATLNFLQLISKVPTSRADYLPHANLPPPHHAPLPLSFFNTPTSKGQQGVQS